jgi:hypothetical protein
VTRDIDGAEQRESAIAEASGSGTKIVSESCGESGANRKQRAAGNPPAEDSPI